LLKETAVEHSLPSGIVSVQAHGTEVAPDMDEVQSPETYVGYQQAQHFASPGGLKKDTVQLYTIPAHLQLNEWGFSGKWIDHGQTAALASSKGEIAFRFHARDLHLVLGPTAEGKPIRFRVMIDGQAPGENHGVDTDKQGNGVVAEHRFYQLVRQKGSIKDRLFVIGFPDPGVQSFVFTFG
jgi:hypothetical protein